MVIRHLDLTGYMAPYLVRAWTGKLPGGWGLSHLPSVRSGDRHRRLEQIRVVESTRVEREGLQTRR